ncbi:MAG: MATE family efflux transporter [Sphaerochaetaceae bacterium]|nr:MATE family efflux transporter [Sphaerochaetaceae bacterium]
MEFKDMKASKLMLRMCIPSIITILIMEIYHMADIFFIGQLGNTAMVSGLSLASPIIALVSTVGVLVGGGGSSALAMMLGKNSRENAEHVVSFSYWTSLFLGLVFGLGLFAFSSSLASLFGARGEAYRYCEQYIRIFSIGVPFMCFANAMGSLIRGNGKSYQSLIGNMTGTVLNIILDPLFILVFKMDVAGAAWATVVSNIASALFYVVYMNGRSFGISCSIKKFTLRKDISLLVLSLGVPMAFMTVLNFVTGTLSRRVLASYGDVAVSAQSITAKVVSFATMLQMGIAMGMQPVFAYFYGAEDKKTLKDYFMKTAIIVVIAGTALTLICFVFGPTLVRFFMDNEEVVKLGARYLNIMLICAPVAGIHTLSTSFFQAVKKPMTSLSLSVIRDGLLYIPLMYALSAMYGMDGYVASRPVSTFISVTVCVFVLYFKSGIFGKEQQ